MTILFAYFCTFWGFLLPVVSTGFSFFATSHITLSKVEVEVTGRTEELEAENAR